MIESSERVWMPPEGRFDYQPEDSRDFRSLSLIREEAWYLAS